MKPNDNPWIDIVPGIRRRTLTHGTTMYQMLAELERGSVMPAHQHAEEQIVHVVSGRVRLIVEGKPQELAAGEAFYLASNVPHGVETLEDTTIIDTFSPPRRDYLEKDKQARA